MPIVCGIKFRGMGKAYYFSPGDLQDLDVDSYVVVETSRGRELGQVVTPVHEIDDSSVVGKLKPIVRHATSLDLLEAQRFRGKESEALAACREQVARFDLAMKIVSAEYSYDGSRLTFFFTSEERVDFRDLVRELARSFKRQMRQVSLLQHLAHAVQPRVYSYGQAAGASPEPHGDIGDLRSAALLFGV